MMPMTDKELIEYHGGATQLARKLAWHDKGAAQRVHNWIERGIPAKVKLSRPDLFLSDFKFEGASQSQIDNHATAV